MNSTLKNLILWMEKHRKKNNVILPHLRWGKSYTYEWRKHMAFVKKELHELGIDPFQTIGNDWFLLTAGTPEDTTP